MTFGASCGAGAFSFTSCAVTCGFSCGVSCGMAGFVPCKISCFAVWGVPEGLAPCCVRASAAFVPCGLAPCGRAPALVWYPCLFPPICLLFCGLNTAEILAFFFGLSCFAVSACLGCSPFSCSGFLSCLGCSGFTAFALGISCFSFSPDNFLRTKFCASSSILFEDVFTSYSVPFSIVITSLESIFNSFASSCTLIFAIYLFTSMIQLLSLPCI